MPIGFAYLRKSVYADSAFAPIKILILVLLACTFCSPVNAENYIIKGFGTQSCGRWIEDREMHNIDAEIKMVWVLGFITAYDELEDVAAGTDADEFFAWIDNYCISRPLDSVALAARRLVISLEHRR